MLEYQEALPPFTTGDVVFNMINTGFGNCINKVMDAVIMVYS